MTILNRDMTLQGKMEWQMRLGGMIAPYLLSQPQLKIIKRNIHHNVHITLRPKTLEKAIPSMNSRNHASVTWSPLKKPFWERELKFWKTRMTGVTLSLLRLSHAFSAPRLALPISGSRNQVSSPRLLKL